MYNVSPDYTRKATGNLYTCDDCGEIVRPQWNGYDSCWQCPECFEDLPDYDEGDE